MEENSLSFAYLRRDHKFGRMGGIDGYDSGFILYPELKTPLHKSARKLLCIFPTNGNSDNRDDRGCGKYSMDKTGNSGPCNYQNITTADQWVEHYHRSNGQLLCGFKMIEKMAAEDFRIALQASTLLRGGDFGRDSNELRVEGGMKIITEQFRFKHFSILPLLKMDLRTQ